MKKQMSIGADHAGFQLKEAVKKYLIGCGYTVEDETPVLYDGDDYPAVAKRVVHKVRTLGGKGILLCDTGAGVAIAANRFRGIRAVPCYSLTMARHARTDNDSNILCLGQEITSAAAAKKIVAVWLATPFSKAVRHARRIKQIDLK